MIKVDASELKRLERDLSRTQRDQVPFAAAQTLTQIAENTRMDTIREMRAKLDRPKDWTLQSLWKRPATKTQLWSMVYLKDQGGNRAYTSDSGKSIGRQLIAESQNKKLKIGHLFTGGVRKHRRFEYLLLHRFGFPQNMMLVPSAGAPRDAWGNVPAGFIMQILSYFAAAQDKAQHMDEKGRARFGKKIGRTSGIGRARVDFFVSKGRGQWYGARSWRSGRGQHLPPGVYMRAQAGGGRTALKPVFLFVSPWNYRQYFDLEQIAARALKRDWAPTFERNLADALRTAK